MSKSNGSYPGKLGRKILLKSPLTERPRSLAPATPEENKNWHDEFQKEFFTNWIGIYKYFDIDPKEKDSALQLAMALAIKHVPGLQITYDRKTNKKWDDGHDMALWYAVKHYQSEKVSVERACELIWENKSIRRNLPSTVLSSTALHKRWKDLQKLPPEEVDQMQKLWNLSSEGSFDPHGFNSFSLSGNTND